MIPDSAIFSPIPFVLAPGYLLHVWWMGMEHDAASLNCHHAEEEYLQKT
jgi:hypothetical protein